MVSELIWGIGDVSFEAELCKVKQRELLKLPNQKVSLTKRDDKGRPWSKEITPSSHYLGSMRLFKN